MNNKLQVLREVTGDDFVQIDTQNFKSELGDALVLTTNEVTDYIKKAAIDEIPYLGNSFLQKYLPEKFNNNFILDEYKELTKFDFGNSKSLLGDLIEDKSIFAWDVTNVVPIQDLVFIDSSVTKKDDVWIFYKLTEN